MRPAARRWLVLVAPAVLFWGVWPWYLGRLADGGTCVVALAAAIILAWRSEGRAGASSPPSAVTHSCAGLLWALGRRPLRGQEPAFAGLLLIYALSWLGASPLVRAACAFLALGVWWSVQGRGRLFDPAISLLMLLALPSGASLDFYLGYPLRRLITLGTSFYLQLSGTGVRAEGAVLRWGDEVVAVDAPCSGLGMLWTGAFLVALMAGLRELRWRETVVAGVAAFAVVLAANVVRAAALFYLEIDAVRLPGWSPDTLHEAVGLLVFAAAAVLIVGMVRRLPSTRQVTA